MPCGAATWSSRERSGKPRNSRLMPPASWLCQVPDNGGKHCFPPPLNEPPFSGWIFWASPHHLKTWSSVWQCALMPKSEPGGGKGVMPHFLSQYATLCKTKAQVVRAQWTSALCLLQFSWERLLAWLQDRWTRVSCRERSRKDSQP